jgi:hypothetical protein
MMKVLFAVLALTLLATSGKANIVETQGTVGASARQARGCRRY